LSIAPTTNDVFRQLFGRVWAG